MTRTPVADEIERSIPGDGLTTTPQFREGMEIAVRIAREFERATSTSQVQPRHERRANVERTDAGVRICWGEHEKGSDCEWIYYLPPSPAPSMQEIERLVWAHGAAAARCGNWATEGAGAEYQAARSALLSAIRSALGPDRYAEGWEAGQAAMQEECALAVVDPKDKGIVRAIRPWAAPEVRTQDNPQDKE